MSNEPTNLSRRAALAGTAAPLSATARATPTDAVLRDLLARYQEALAHNATLDARIKLLLDELWISQPHMDKEAYLRLSEEEQEAYREQRLLDLGEASNNSGLTALHREQDHFLETVLDPLEMALCETAPTTLEGIAIKAALIRDHVGAAFLRTGKPKDLDWDKRVLHQFVEQLAALSGSLPGRAS